MTGKDPISPRAAGEDDAIDIAAMVYAIWAGKVWIAISVALVVFCTMFYTLGTASVYRATALIQLESSSGSLALPESMQELLGGDMKSSSATATESLILRSRMVVGAAVRELKMQTLARPIPMPVLRQLPQRLGLPDLSNFFGRAYAWGNESISVADLEVPEGWMDQDMRLVITGPGTYAIGLPDKTVHEGKVKERMVLPEAGFALLVDQLEGPVGRVFLVTQRNFHSTVGDVQRRLAVKADSNSFILTLTYDDTRLTRAQTVLDAITRAYVAQNVERSAAVAGNSLQFIEDQLPQAQKTVADAQQALNEYRQKQKSVDIDYETRTLLEQATVIEGQLSELALKEEEIRKQYTVNHPTYQALLENRAGLQAQLDEIRKQTLNLPETQKEIFNLTRDLEVSQQVYVQLLNRAQELRVMKASSVGSVRIIDTAYADPRAISPRLQLAMAVAVLLGLLLGTAAIFIRQTLRRGIRGAQEIEQIGLPVFATINFSPEAMNNRKMKGFLPILAVTRPDDVVVESLRSLRTSLHFGMLDSDTKAVLLTSSAPGAGKSFTAVNLAVVAAQAGQRVCVIDADLRKGYLRRYFGLEKGTPGLADYLAGDRTLDDVLIAGPVPGLSVIVTGRFPPNPSELIMRSEFATLLSDLRERFDLILVDSPPALAVTDPVILARYVGTTIVVARHMETMLAEIEAVRRAFETAGGKIAGAVLNGYKAEEGSRYGGQYHYYNYRYSYRSEKN